MFNKNYLIGLFFVFSVSSIFGEVTVFHKPLHGSPWLSDSLFVGAEIIVKDSTIPVTVSWSNSQYTKLVGKLFWLKKVNPDSAVFLFHNVKGSFQSESTPITIGKFPVGTKLYFCYIVTDSSASKQYYLKKIYSGQNRSGIDTLLSERTGKFGLRHSLVGKINDNTIELSFDDQGDFLFSAIIIKIVGVVLGKD